MATFDLTKGGPGAVPGHQPPAVVFLEGILDQSKQALAQNDVAQLIHVPANTEILSVFWQVLKASSNAGTFNLGDGASATRWFTGSALSALADAHNTTRFFYTTADTIDVVQTAALTVSTGILRVMALAVHFEPSTQVYTS